MPSPNFTTVISVDSDPSQAYSAILDVPGWYTCNLMGATDTVGDSFLVSFGKTWIRFRVERLVPGRQVVWSVVDCHKHFLRDKREWKGTQVEFVIQPKDLQTTTIHFNHYGLTEPLECYTVCSDAWTGYLQGSLRSFINTGQGRPDPVATSSYVSSAD